MQDGFCGKISFILFPFSSQNGKSINCRISTENIKPTNAPAFLAILFALMSVFSTKTFLVFWVSLSRRSFWYGAAALSVASTANLLIGPCERYGAYSDWWNEVCMRKESLEKHKTLLANQLETELTDEGP